MPRRRNSVPASELHNVPESFVDALLTMQLRYISTSNGSNVVGIKESTVMDLSNPNARICRLAPYCQEELLVQIADVEKFKNCDYADETTEAQSLQDQISILEARIQELESGETNTTSKVTGYNLQETGSEVYLYAAPSSVQLSASGFEDIPPVLSRMLMHNFIHKSCSLCFFLDRERFKYSVLNETEGERPTFALLNTSYLWGMLLSSSEHPPEQEAILVSRALQSSAHALSENHPQKVLQCIQSEVLLANYFYRAGRTFEGKYHATAAASLILSSGTHKIRTSSPDTSGYLATSNVNPLTEPSDAIEEGERINVFWAVLALDAFWNTVHGVPSSIPYTSPMTRVDTPWPRMMEEYTRAPFDAQFRSSHTIERFLSGALDSGIPNSVTSPKANFARAAILFERATFTGLQLYNTIPSKLQFSRHSHSEIVASLLPPDRTLGAPLEYQFCMHSLAHAADIQLHLPFASQNNISRTRIFAAAKAIVNLIDNWGHVFENDFVDPMLAVIWTIACNVFIDESIQMQYAEACTLCERVMSAMERHPFPLMSCVL
ncbi:hypothetical protein BT96DRAFT_994641 [Gymnopus androsaceus JB14]|uniref:Xylanolytic transcriptional activator regulatory domain-containing protein n=1 Tax=Gymnopus androsaceus JB14 TaxID=1447944 RepID=A0A6A4HPK1_9AGAR|nr:hypothetical protein BT96DRAFT_994641 [Gymnopus androsaceus JB14]